MAFFQLKYSSLPKLCVKHEKLLLTTFLNRRWTIQLAAECIQKCDKIRPGLFNTSSQSNLWVKQKYKPKNVR